MANPASNAPPPMPGSPKPAPVVQLPAAPSAEALETVPNYGEPKRGFLEQPWVQEVLPFVMSVLIHVAIIAIGVVFFFGVQYVQNKAAHQEEVIIPNAAMVDGSAPGGVPNQGLDNDPTRQAMQDRFKDGGTPEGWSDKKGSKMNLAPSGGGGEGDATDSIIGKGPGGGFGKGGGHGSGVGNELGAGEGDGGPLAMFGTPGGGALGIKGAVFGNSGNAKKIAFICDASGSMVSKFSTLRRELSKTIKQLRPVQSFSLIFFQQQSCMYLDASLTMATPDAKLRADKFLETVTPRAETNPLPALDLAFKQGPELIYLLTDGDFPDNDAVLAKIRALNKNGRVKINTIAFVSDTDTETAFMDLLKKISTESGGVYRHVREGDI